MSTTPRNIILIAVSTLLWATLAYCDSLKLSDDWNIRLNHRAINHRKIDFPWRTLEASSRHITVEYLKAFDITMVSEKKHFIIIPPIWVDFKLSFNEYTIEDAKSYKFPGKIYQYHIFEIPKILIKNHNQVNIVANGDIVFGGFREPAVIFTDNEELVAGMRMKNFFLNDIHVPIIIFSLFLAAFCVFLIKIGQHQNQGYILLVISILTSIPHHLLATNFYNTLLMDSVLPFKVQQAFQTFLWPSAIAFYLMYSSRFRKKVTEWVSNPRYLIGFYFVPTMILICSFTITTEYFFNLTTIFFSIISFIAIVALFSMKERPVFILAYFISLVLNLLVFASDLAWKNFYFMAYGFIIMAVVGTLVILKEIALTAKHHYLLNQFINQFLPRSVFNKISILVNEKRTYHEILELVSGRANLCTVLIDICDWGKLNSYETSKIPMGFAKKARSLVFNEFEKIMARHNLELLKTSGDNMKFCGGLYYIGQKREVVIAERALRAIREILDNVNSINANLRKKNLPIMEIKVAATLGNCDFGIEKYAERGQFDTQGHYVNMAYRLETGMNGDFYNHFGRNVAAISDQLIQECDDLELLSQFPDSYVISDKHGLSYPCHIGKHLPKELTVEAFANALFSFFRASDSTLISNVATEKIPDHKEAMPICDSSNSQSLDPLEKRQITREKVYLRDNVKVELSYEDHVISGEVIDFNPGGLGIMVSSDQDIESFSLNLRVSIQYKIKQQVFAGEGEIVRIVKKDLSHGSFFLFAIQLVEPQRVSIEREFKRYDVSGTSFPPTLVIEVPYSFENNGHFQVMNLSRSGMRLKGVGQGSGLLIGLRVNATLQLPFVGEVRCPVGIQCATTLENKVYFGINVLENLNEFQNAVSKYLLLANQGAISLHDLKNDGFPVGKATEILICRYAEDESDIADICKLRLKAWQANGHFLDVKEPGRMIDRFDQNSCQIMIFAGKRVIGAARVTFNHGNSDDVEHISYGVKIPQKYFTGGFVELGRIVVDPEFRGGDILRLIIFHLARISLDSHNKYAIGSSCDKLFRFYELCGFEKIATYPGDDSKIWRVGSLDVESCANYRKFTPVGYALGFDRLFEHLSEQGLARPGVLGKINHSFMKVLKPTILKKVS